MDKRFNWTEKDIIKVYNQGFSQKECSKMFNIHRTTLTRILKRENVESRGCRFYTLNEHYFKEINSKDKAYFLGLLMADGCNTNTTVKINLQINDIILLQLFKNYIEYTGSIKINVSKTINKKDQCLITLCSKKLCKDLTNLGCIKAKSHYTYFPDIPEEFYSHFIRGVFDGDGSIWFSKCHHFEIIGNNVLIEKIQEILMKECNLNKTKFRNNLKSKNNIIAVTYGGNKQVKKIGEYLYKDCEDLYLPRKKEKIDKIILQKKKPILKCKQCDKLGNKAKGFCSYHYEKQRLQFIDYKQLKVKNV